MRVIAKSDGSDVFLIDMETRDRAFVFDREAGVRYPPMHRESILARGYWIEIENDPEIVAEAMKLDELVIEGLKEG